MIINAKNLAINNSKFEYLNFITYSVISRSLFWVPETEDYYEENFDNFLSVISEGGAGYFYVDALMIFNLSIKLSKGS